MREIGIRKTHDSLKKKLIDYIKAQYLAENDLLMDAADELLLEKEVLYQEPYIEVTKNYKMLSNGFVNAKLDVERKDILKSLIDSGLGVFKTPFQHQVNAIENYYEGKNIMVTTGTGSGKTECFLWPILTDLIYESYHNEKSWKQEGIRALVLYPMNALVSDQLGRMRNIIGRKDDVFHKILCGKGKRRRVRFGMYTGRTPYAGQDDEKKNKNLASLIRKNYIESNAHDELKEIGRIPSKNLEKFYKNLSKGLQITDSEDAELYTRGEMQKICPDILITNYSMLEYMLMRPIEDNFWNKTIQWINAAEDNKLLLIIDEAHMYRGAAGGEVSLLIRRLMDKLGINSSKVKCILTSASVPADKNSELQKFACGLTGKDPDHDSFKIIREETEKIDNYKLGTMEQASFYASLSLSSLQGEFEQQLSEYNKLVEMYKWSKVPIEADKVGHWLFEKLAKDSLMRQLIHVCSEKGKAFSAIAKEIFEEDVPVSTSEQALEILMQLGTMAKTKAGKVLLGSKVHMLFKGLQGLFTCVNPNCTHSHEGMGIKLGYITDKNIETCPHCGGRMFELMMDRKCGTLYVRVFIDDEMCNVEPFDFLWPRHNQIIKATHEMHLWIMPENRTDLFKLNKKSGKTKEKSVVGYLDSKTGLLFREESHAGEEGYLKVLISDDFSKENEAYSFATCPNCGKDYNRITPFVTRGNEPFANIVKAQFESQVSKDMNLNNEGKKVLLFSDSRQRAATLARDMTISSDGDAGRQAIFIAQKLLENSRGSDNTLDLLYYAFLKVVYDNKLNFFYGEEKDIFKNHLKKYEEFYASSSRVKFKYMREDIGSPPQMFYQLLLKNISDSYRSFNNLGLGQVVLAESGDAGERLEFQILEKVEILTGISEEDIRAIYNTWIQYLLVRKIAIFPEIGDDVRNSILAYDRRGFGVDEVAKFPQFMNEILRYHGVTDDKVQILLDKFDFMTERLQSSERNHNRKFIFGSRLELKTAENSKWYKCHRCAGVSTYTLWGHCIYCGSNDHVHLIDEEHLKRYSLWRLPVLNAITGEKIRNITTEEHTAQLSYKDAKKNVWVTTEKHELAFRNITLEEDEEPIDVLSCTTTMEVGIDIGSLTSVGLRNVPPMRENYQQRAGRAGRAGAAVSSIVTYTENGPHDAWYFKHPSEIISGIPRIPWIDATNMKLVKRHINLILLQEYLRTGNMGLDDINTINFFDAGENLNYLSFIDWAKENISSIRKRENILIPVNDFNWKSYVKELDDKIGSIAAKVEKAPFMYTPPVKLDDSRSYLYRLMDVLFSEGVLPNYSFPRNIVHFWIEDLNGVVKESPERSIDIALSEYAPGRSLVVNKQTYISGGLFDYYTKFQKDKKFNAAEAWLGLDEYNKNVTCCTNPFCGWFGVNETYGKCPLCSNTLESHTMIKPWGFAAREGRNIPETHEDQEMSYASQPSYSSMPSGGEMKEVGIVGYIRMENRDNQKLVIINKGPEEEGFELCKECGAIEPNIGNPTDRKNRKRPYKIPYMKDDSMKCRHDYSNVYLGYEFNTDMMVLELKLDESKLDLEAPFSVWLIPALTTFTEGLALAASRELDVEFSDMKSGFRIRTVGNSTYADVYLYDSLSSGAGYAGRVSKLIDSVLNKMKEIFEGCNCSASCPNCLQHFWNQRQKSNLDRFLGSDFLEFIRGGRLRVSVKKEEQKKYFDQIIRIAEMQGYYNIIYKNNGKFYLKTRNGKREMIIYPAMCNLKVLEAKNKICLSDRMCRYAISEIWQRIRQQL
ncbi:DEAD/DEAH box helicase [Brassicibacter mesophilus]|uniref:DEAD/DEAH box helicase n=1 Tax=Brassicibacter mesophilus TaxID=745119 RepID=UPI003D245C42